MSRKLTGTRTTAVAADAEVGDEEAGRVGRDAGPRAHPVRHPWHPGPVPCRAPGRPAAYSSGFPGCPGLRARRPPPSGPGRPARPGPGNHPRTAELAPLPPSLPVFNLRPTGQHCGMGCSAERVDRAGRLLLGAAPDGWVMTSPEQAVLVIGPPRSGKTTSVVVPNVMAAEGPVLSTSTKPDVLRATLSRRSHQGRCWLYDPTGEIEVPAGVESLRWSPVVSAERWDPAVRMAATGRQVPPGPRPPSWRTGTSGPKPCWRRCSTPRRWPARRCPPSAAG